MRERKRNEPLTIGSCRRVVYRWSEGSMPKTDPKRRDRAFGVDFKRGTPGDRDKKDIGEPRRRRTEPGLTK